MGARSPGSCCSPLLLLLLLYYSSAMLFYSVVDCCERLATTTRQMPEKCPISRDMSGELLLSVVVVVQATSQEGRGRAQDGRWLRTAVVGEQARGSLFPCHHHHSSWTVSVCSLPQTHKHTHTGRSFARLAASVCQQQEKDTATSVLVVVVAREWPVNQPCQVLRDYSFSTRYISSDRRKR